MWLGLRGMLSGKCKTDGYDGTPLRPCSKQQPLSCNGVKIATVERGLTCKRQEGAVWNCKANLEHGYGLILRMLFCVQIQHAKHVRSGHFNQKGVSVGGYHKERQGHH